MCSVYQIAIESMGPRFDVRIVKTLGFNKVTIRPHNAVVHAV